MKLVRTLAVAVMTFALLACDDREGTVTVTNTLQLLNSKDKWVTIAPGSYEAEVGASSKTKAKIEFEIGGKEVKAYFKMPENSIQTGNFTIPAATNGQKYDLIGKRDIDYDDTETTRTRESCTYYTTEVRCEWVNGPEQCTVTRTCDAAGNCTETRQCVPGRQYRECRDVQVSHTGSHDVEYYYRTTTDYMEVGLAQPGQTQTDAKFQSTEVSTNKHYTYEGYCDRY